MKYVVVVGDGMADEPLEELGGRTPLEVSRTPHMDHFARNGRVGLVRTIPEGMPAGSDVANMSLMGYSPRTYYTGRAPLEAASMGLDLGPDDVAFRCNLVTLEERDEGLFMGDYSGGSISLPDLPVVPAPEGSTAKLIAGAVALAANRAPPAERKETQQTFLRLGLEIVNGISRWE